MKIHCDYSDIIPLKDLIPHPQNPNKHNKKQIKLLAKIMKKQGVRSPIVVSELSGYIVKGHCTALSALENKWTEFPVDYQPFKNKKMEYAHLVADNKIAQLSEHDDKLMLETLEEIDFDLDMELLGMPAEDNEIPTEEDLAKKKIEDQIPIKMKGRCKIDDLWILGEHRLLCGDATSVSDVAKLMDGTKADMVFTDPPYGIGESASKRKTRETNSLAKSNSDLKEFKDDSIEYAISAYNICQTLNISKQFWWGANYYCHSLPQTNNWVIWDKRVEDKQKDNNSDCELAWVKSKWSSVRIFRHLWKGLIKGSEHGQKRVHPTQKPIALAEWCFDYYKSDFKNVLDLFGGSGSTLIACEKTNRKCFMMEIDPHYCDVIIQRWENYSKKKAKLHK